MLVKTVSTILTVNSAGQVVESKPVISSDVPVLDGTGHWIDPVDMTEDPFGVPIRIVTDPVVQNSVGKWVQAIPGEGVGVPAGYAALRSPVDNSIIRAANGSPIFVKVH